VAVVRSRVRAHDVSGNDGEYSVTIIAQPQRSSEHGHASTCISNGRGGRHRVAGSPTRYSMTARGPVTSTCDVWPTFRSRWSSQSQRSRARRRSRGALWTPPTIASNTGSVAFVSPRGSSRRLRGTGGTRAVRGGSHGGRGSFTQRDLRTRRARGARERASLPKVARYAPRLGRPASPRTEMAMVGRRARAHGGGETARNRRRYCIVWQRKACRALSSAPCLSPDHPGKQPR
jgi:hypothetical protein